MTYRGHVRNGQITLDEPARLPEGVAVNVEVVDQVAEVTRPPQRTKLRDFRPIQMPGSSLADELVQDRR
jgi:hypothetical protein